MLGEQHHSSLLVGRIVEKGFSSSALSGAPASSPRLTVLPFPVARHRSHGPHWTPVATTTGAEEDDAEEDKDIVDYGLAAPLARPMKKIEKKGLDFSRWRELLDGKHSTFSSKVKQKHESAVVLKPVDKEMGDAIEAPAAAAELGLKRKETDSIFSPVADTSISRVETRDRRTRKQGEIEYQSVRQPTSMDVDYESLDSTEIADSQAEIMGKMDPTILAMLRKRGQDKRRNMRATPAEEKGKTSLNGANLVERAKSSYQEEAAKPERSEIPQDAANRQSETTTSSEKMESSAINNEWAPSGVGDSGSWKSWCQRVEKVRLLRFRLDGNVINDDIPMELKNGLNTSFSQYNPENVAERDFLRTEGDPGAAGYTIKEAIALTRSIIPSQRCFALQLLASVLHKCLHHLQQKDADSNLSNANCSHKAVDWQAIWAYVLGPEPEIALSLRISLDDNHNSVILASAKVFQSILSFDVNEFYFNLSEKLCVYEIDVYTAPIFRSRPDINFGYLHGGFWKYSSKPSNILPFNDQYEDADDEERRTIQDDVVLAGQDIAGGLVRMGILPRICYLLEVDPLPTLDECLVSILVALARHSPSCATAIIKCPRLIETVVHRFTKHLAVDVHPSMIKSVVLLRVLSQSDRQNCSEFVRCGFFRDMMWHMYRGPISLDQWIKSGKEHRNLTSCLMVEQLRFWKVCIRHGYCASYFDDFFPVMCTWLNLPTLDRLVGENVLEEFALVTREAYHVLEALSHRLPRLHSEVQLEREVSEFPNDMESWSWSRVVPMVELATKWLSLKTSSLMPLILPREENSVSNESNSAANCILWVISAIMHMLSSIFDKVIPKDSLGHEEGTAVVLPWLPFFIPKVGLEIVKNGIFDFADPNGRVDKGVPGGNMSLVSVLCQLRTHNALETSFSSVSCLHGLVRLVNSVDKCIQKDYSGTDDKVLEDGISKGALTELSRVLSLFMTLAASGWQHMLRTEVSGRGGPAPGIGLGWGSSGGGFWSTKYLLAQAEAHLIMSLSQPFRFPVTDGSSEMAFALPRINAILGVCLISGPRDRIILEKALDVLLQAPVLEFLGFCIDHFIHVNRGLKSFRWQYCYEDYRYFSNMLSSHFRSFWLSFKSKSSSKRDDSSTKDMETSEVGSKYPDACSLQVEWAYQRLPLPAHWFLSPLSCVMTGGDANNPSSSYRMTSDIRSSGDCLDVAKSGLLFLLGLEALSYLTDSMNSDFPVQAVPLIWKLHALSMVLLVRMETADVLEDAKSRDNYECLQEFYGQKIDQLRLQNGRSTQARNHNAESSSEGPSLLEAGKNHEPEFLNFQTQVHESYATFIETLIEQFGAVSYGNVLYGRQIALYLHRSVEVAVRLAAWNSLVNSHVLELLPPLDKCFGEAEGYLEPVEDNEGILEAYAKTWVSEPLDRAAARGSITFALPMHHLSCFIFNGSSDKVPFRNKLVKSLLRGYSRKPQLKKMLLCLIRYERPKLQCGHDSEVTPLQESESIRRFDILSAACEGNSSLLCELGKLKLP
ncbi:unnamed protein product [Spirodela intermedia]|uniref:Uncharacterized protein n=1 Tax=Spirodela intermedia TaxID=51605 RepID=A0A7I8J8T2_SPIIN|nr:unnamed protein product [Spirodela intermedia]CAA6666185.1 unnamed protein product [Spirodela intermedia]